MVSTASNIRSSGIRKAAILVASLDQAAVDVLLDQLTPECADRVRRAVTAIDRIDADEQQRVVDEFRRIGPMVPGKCPPGIELDAIPAAERASTPVSPDDEPPFGFLHGAEEENLSRLLGGERPQTVALVLSHLPPARAGELLARFAPPLQTEILRRLVDLDAADPETLKEVEQSLESRLSRQTAVERSREMGAEVVSRILAACEAPVAGTILDSLAKCDRPLAERLGHRSIEFEELVRFDDAMLSEIFRAVEPAVVEAALLGAPPQLVERVVRCVAADEARSLRRKLDNPGPIRLSDVEDARRQIAALARRMSSGARSKTALAA